MPPWTQTPTPSSSPTPTSSTAASRCRSCAPTTPPCSRPTPLTAASRPTQSCSTGRRCAPATASRTPGATSPPARRSPTPGLGTDLRVRPARGPLRHRGFVQAHATAACLLPTAVSKLVIGAEEVLTNALLHGGPPRQLSVYTEGPALVCHVSDGGLDFADLLGAYLPPDQREAAGEGGRGLWIAHQLSDALELGTSATGTHLRLLRGSTSGSRARRRSSLPALQRRRRTTPVRRTGPPGSRAGAR
ncbi:MAG: ATP-binding protein [Acidimicrobiales bacterium]